MDKQGVSSATALLPLAIALWACPALSALGTTPAAFSGAVGQGAAATGGRGGDVYHVVSLEDYDPKTEEKIPGSFRHAIRSAEGPRTIVFDVSGPIALRTDLEIRKSDLTIAGQTSPGGITLWGYPVEVSAARNVVIRFLRVRLGDFHVKRPAGEKTPPGGRGNLDAAAGNALYVGNGSERVILDHVSASWAIDETLSVTKARDVTVQNCLIAESLNRSLHPKGPHGFGSLVRGVLTASDQAAGVGGFTFYGNVWAHHRGRMPSLGGQQKLEPGQSEADRGRTDVNLVNNVVYNWGNLPMHRSEGGEVRANVLGNYCISGPAKNGDYSFREDVSDPTIVFQRGNWQDLDEDGEHDGAEIMPGDAADAFRDFGPEDRLVSEGQPLGFLDGVSGQIETAERAYERALATAGASLWRDAVDRRVIDSLKNRTGGLIDSQEELRDAEGRLPGIDDLPLNKRPEGFDSDGDGMPDEFEKARGLDPQDPADGNAATLSREGYTNLEVYLNALTVPTEG